MEQVKYEFKLVTTMKPSNDRLEDEKQTRIKRRAKIIPFGISYFDDAMGGIKNDDVLLVSAGSGAGKTEIATFMATQAAKAGNKVVYLALEASVNEIESRIKYRMLAEAYYETNKHERKKPIRYLDWNYGKCEEQLAAIEPEIDQQFKEKYENLTTYYRDAKAYTIEDFEKQFMAIKEDADLIVIDHLHYIDFGDEVNEIKALRRIVKEISDLANTHSKPVILVAHIRKLDKRYSLPVPTLDDIYGSSDVAKIATKAIMLARKERSANTPKDRSETYLRILKDRNDGSLVVHTAVMSFNSARNVYDNNYLLGSFVDGQWQAYTEKEQMPFWATRAVNKLGE